MTAGQICAVLLVLTTLLQIQPMTQAETCPAPDAREKTIIVTKKYYSNFGTLYRFVDSLNRVDNGWEVVSGEGDDEISYFKAYAGPVGKQFSGCCIEGYGKTLRCGGFEREVHVCRAAQSLSHNSRRVYYDYFSRSECDGEERMVFYVSDHSREYERTTRFKAGVCENGRGNRATWYGYVGYQDPPQSVCDNKDYSFSFHALRGPKLCSRIEVAPPSAAIEHTETAEGGLHQVSLRFRCYTGYVTDDGGTGQTISCYNGAWSENPKACHNISCRHPGTPRNGEIHGFSYNYGDEVTFSCDHGYWMEGRGNLYCQANGRWDGDIPACNRKRCEGLLAPANGIKVGTDVGTGATMTFACHQGYTLVGEVQITCEEVEGEIAGAWSSDVPTCQEVTCQPPIAPENGVVSGVDFTFGGTITFRCHPGYLRTGASMARCGLNGEWDSPIPTCTALECNALQAPENGEMDGQDFSFGSRVDFSCGEGFTIVGSSSLICRDDGRWSDNTPRCQAVACPELPTIENGVRIGAASNEYGIQVNFQCFPGYQLVGEPSTGCRSNRQWTNPPPICQVCERNWYKAGSNTDQCQQCPEHSTTLTDASPSIDHCNCLEGYVKLDDNSCQPVSCAPLEAPLNGSIAEDCSNDFGGTCTFNCDPGFVISSGSRRVTCRASGWSSAAPICNECPLNTYKETEGSLTCHPCPRNSHTFERAGTSPDSCVCVLGYEHPEDSNECIDVDECANENGGCNHDCVNTAGSFYCQCNIAGYELEADGRTCVATRSCDELDSSMLNGNLDCRYTATENGNICFIKCNDGFFFVSGQNDYVTCGVETNWQWSHRLVNASASVPACTEEFYVDTKIQMSFAYSLGAGGCNNLGLFSEQLKAVIAEGIETVPPCQSRCWVSETTLECTEPEEESEDQTSRLTATADMYLINVEQNAVGPECDMTCRSSNLRQMYGDTFAVVTAVENIVQSSGQELTLRQDEAPALLNDSFTRELPSILCKRQGHVLTKLRLCVPCAPGTYLPDPTLEVCERCPIGTYQRLSGQVSCDNCPEDSTTLTDGSDHPTQCSERISVIGLNPEGLTVERRRRSVGRIADEDIDIDEVLSFL